MILRRQRSRLDDSVGTVRMLQGKLASDNLGTDWYTDDRVIRVSSLFMGGTLLLPCRNMPWRDGVWVVSILGVSDLQLMGAH